MLRERSEKTADAREPAAGSRSDRTSRLLVAGVLLLVFALLVSTFLVPLAVSRYVHVDESQLAYNASLLGLHHLPGYVNYHAPFIVPLSWIAARGGEAWHRLLEMRAIFFALFLLVLGLIASSAPRIRGVVARSGALLGIVLVEPFWRHGFEIRHDVLMVASSVLLFALCQRAAAARAGIWTFAMAGAVSGWMQLNSFKAFLIWPAALLFLFVASWLSPGVSIRPLRAIAATLSGLIVALVSGFALLASAGITGIYLRGLLELSLSAGEASRFGGGILVVRLLAELPHLTVLAFVGGAFAVAALRRGEVRACLSSILTLAWLVLELAAFNLNPAPFTYNLVHLIPFLYLAAVDGFGALYERSERLLRQSLLVLVAAASMVSFTWSWTHDVIGRTGSGPQRRHVEAAEALTAASDPVLDAAGLVLSRRPPGREWMLHSLFMPSYRRGEREPFHGMLRKEPAPVLLTNYRWEWLGPEDRELVKERYVALGPRLLILGGRREAGGTIEIHRAGRYRVLALGPDPPLRVDGAPLPREGVLELNLGLHALSGAASWAWLGPSLLELPEPGPLYPNRDLFVSD